MSIPIKPELSADLDFLVVNKLEKVMGCRLNYWCEVSVGYRMRISNKYFENKFCLQVDVEDFNRLIFVDNKGNWMFDIAYLHSEFSFPSIDEIRKVLLSKNKQEEW